MVRVLFWEVIYMGKCIQLVDCDIPADWQKKAMVFISVSLILVTRPEHFDWIVNYLQQTVQREIVLGLTDLCKMPPIFAKYFRWKKLSGFCVAFVLFFRVPCTICNKPSGKGL